MTASPMPEQETPPGTSGLWLRLLRLHDETFSDAGRVRLKHVVVWASLVGFFLHLGLILAARCLPHAHLLMEMAGTHYLAAIATPFNFILFYEVMTLIAALPASTTRSIANQFEIVSLVFIREVFKDFAMADRPEWVKQDPHAALPLVLDMGSGLLMFLLTAVFQHLAQRQVPMPRTAKLLRGREEFIAQKKVVSLGLTLLLLVLACYHLTRFLLDVWHVATLGGAVSFESAGIFYNDLFTVMIFTDVVVLILSLVVSARYEMVFRNAAFVASIIVIRFALTEPQPWGALIALSAMAFAILTLLVFNYHSAVRAAGTQTIPDEH
ncbi:hypothetical protein [Silvibacterium dinghuense]|uniref:Uncharacterized protein n=1 Tax=Silvibacterium dinghuense TaxID=1560006 RepID=A0A4Q1S9S8_9BACT|nr:hypothetical protein [Silvibacterium dinghuense]RXS93788.1 hypothetical protein ESZ00_17240 [Silvibacterium dinghuense]GGH07628.1 hypothetical protein GCM10011586_24950 [Silvibacterium dinghuense]